LLLEARNNARTLNQWLPGTISIESVSNPPGYLNKETRGEIYKPLVTDLWNRSFSWRAGEFVPQSRPQEHHDENQA